MWCIWRERNDWNFENSERTVVELKAFFFYALYQWMAAYMSVIFLVFLTLFFFKKNICIIKKKKKEHWGKIEIILWAYYFKKK